MSTYPSPKRDYTQWGTHFEHPSLSEFLTCTHLDEDVHTVSRQKAEPIEFLVRETPLDTILPDFPSVFPGALSADRSKTSGPYFAGSSFSPRVSDLIAFAWNPQTNVFKYSPRLSAIT